VNVVQERDRLASRAIGLVAAATIAITLFGVAVAGAILKLRASPETRPEAARARSRIDEVNGMEMGLYARARASDRRVPAVARLNSYGWVDRNAGVVHIPIEIAFELYLAREPGQGPHSQLDPERHRGGTP
jgi:hypothetical protein